MAEDKPVYIHVCKDRTLSYRTEDEPIFNGVAIAVYNVATKEEAEALVTLVGARQYEEHPQMPGQLWRKINIGFKRELDVEDLPEVTRKLADAHERLKRVAAFYDPNQGGKNG